MTKNKVNIDIEIIDFSLLALNKAKYEENKQINRFVNECSKPCKMQDIKLMNYLQSDIKKQQLRINLINRKCRLWN